MDRVARRGPLARAPGALKGGHFRNCQHFSRREKSLKYEAESMKGGTLWDFSTSILSQNSKKLKGRSFGLARYGTLRGKTGKTFLIQFARPNGAIIFCRTFKNYFG